MSVYKHSYRAYTGEITSPHARILVLARYGMAQAWSSKITVALLTFSLLPFLVSLIGIYVANNPIAQLMIFKGSRALTIDAGFFLKVLENGCWFALVLASWVAPRLVTFDLADNALPILLSHPISRFGYVLGKFLALFAMLSTVTWIPALLLFAFQGYSSQVPWTLLNLRVGLGIFVGAAIWIVFLSLLSLALSSWVKWRVVATGIIFAVVLVPAGVGAIVTAVLRTRWGLLLNLPVMMSSLWQHLLGADPMPARYTLPTASILVMLLVGALIFAAMLNARIRARGVVKG